MSRKEALAVDMRNNLTPAVVQMIQDDDWQGSELISLESLVVRPSAHEISQNYVWAKPLAMASPTKAHLLAKDDFSSSVPCHWMCRDLSPTGAVSILHHGCVHHAGPDPVQKALPPGHLEGRDSGAFGWTRGGEGQEAYPSLEVFVAEYFRVLRPEDP